MSPHYFLSLGSNIQPERHIPACLEALKQKFSMRRISSIYETDPVGPREGSKFWNAVVEIKTDMQMEALVTELRRIESSLGRQRDPADKFAPRTIDIDVLPQAGYQDLGFIIVPLAEMAPDEKDPETGKSFLELAEKFKEEKKKYKKVKA